MSLPDQSPQQAQDEYFEDQDLAFLPAAHVLFFLFFYPLILFS